MVFPVRRGERAGEQRKRMTHAKAFRRDLRSAFGLELWDGETWRTAGDKEQPKKGPKPRKPTPRERTLLEGDANTLPVDFHSWRRAFSQALAEAGVNEQVAMGLSGHESEDAHRRYLRNAERLRALPIAALPRLNVSGANACAKSPLPDVEPSVFLAPPARVELATNGLGNRCSIH